VPVIQLDAAKMKSQNDFFDRFFEAVDAPDWHGRNFDALADSIGSGAINKVEVPYRLAVRNLDAADSVIKGLIGDFADLIENLQRNGCPVEMRIEPDSLSL
jgi:RNAse (barnase) inhibitor barstar